MTCKAGEWCFVSCFVGSYVPLPDAHIRSSSRRSKRYPSENDQQMGRGKYADHKRRNRSSSPGWWRWYINSICQTVSRWSICIWWSWGYAGACVLSTPQQRLVSIAFSTPELFSFARIALGTLRWLVYLWNNKHINAVSFKKETIAQKIGPDLVRIHFLFRLIMAMRKF